MRAARIIAPRGKYSEAAVVRKVRGGAGDAGTGRHRAADAAGRCCSGGGPQRLESAITQGIEQTMLLQAAPTSGHLSLLSVPESTRPAPQAAARPPTPAATLAPPTAPSS